MVSWPLFERLQADRLIHELMRKGVAIRARTRVNESQYNGKELGSLVSEAKMLVKIGIGLDVP